MSEPHLTVIARLIYKWRIVGVLIATVAIAVILVPEFRQPADLEVAVNNVQPIGLMALGETLVIFMGCIDLSVGSILALAGIVAVILQGSMGPWPAMVLGVLSGTLVGLGNGLIVTRLGVNAFIATLGTMIGVSGIAFTISSGQPISAADFEFGFPITSGLVWWLTPPTVAFVVICLFIHIVVTRVRVGRNLMSAGGSREASLRAGLSPNKYVLAAFVASGTCSGLAGVLLALGLATGSPIIGADSVLPVVAAVVLGGASLKGGSGSVIKTAVGVLIIGTLNSAMNLANVTSWDQNIVIGVVLLLVVLADSLGGSGRFPIWSFDRRARRTNLLLPAEPPAPTRGT